MQPQMQLQRYEQDGDSQMAELLDDEEKLTKYLEQLEACHFQMMKSCLKQPKQFKSKKSHAINKQASSLGNIKYQAKRLKLENVLAHHLRYTGFQVKQYSSDSCLVLYDVSVVGESVAQFAIKMCKVREPDEWALKKYYLPMGFSLSAINENFAPMTQDYLNSIHKALTAHFNRLWQIKLLKDTLPKYADVQNSLNGTHVELCLKLRPQNSPEVIEVSFKLQYEYYKTRPTDIEITKFGITDTNSMLALKDQLKPFQLATLQRAFMMCFHNENGPYTCLTDRDLAHHERNTIQSKGEKIDYLNNGNDWSDGDENYVEKIRHINRDNLGKKMLKNPFANSSNRRSNPKNRCSSSEESSDSESDISVEIVHSKKYRKEKSPKVRNDTKKYSPQENSTKRNKLEGKKVVKGSKIAKKGKSVSPTSTKSSNDTTLDDKENSGSKKQRGTHKDNKKPNKESKKKPQKSK